MAEPTITPSASLAICPACSGVEMPKPMAQGIWVFSRTAWTIEPRSVVILLRVPVTPRLVEEPLRLFGDGGDAVLRGGGDEGDKVQAVGAAGGSKLLLLLVGHVGEDDAVHPNLRRPRQEAVGAVGEHHVGVGHKHQGDGYVLSQLLHQGEDFVRGDTSL